MLLWHGIVEKERDASMKGYSRSKLIHDSTFNANNVDFVDMKRLIL